MLLSRPAVAALREDEERLRGEDFREALRDDDLLDEPRDEDARADVLRFEVPRLDELFFALLRFAAISISFDSPLDRPLSHLEPTSGLKAVVTFKPTSGDAVQDSKRIKL